MRVTKLLQEGGRLIALLGAIALVIWSMAEYKGLHAQNSRSAAQLPAADDSQ